jgi:hypothetical protein
MNRNPRSGTIIIRLRQIRTRVRAGLFWLKGRVRQYTRVRVAFFARGIVMASAHQSGHTNCPQSYGGRPSSRYRRRIITLNPLQHERRRSTVNQPRKPGAILDYAIIQGT